MPTENGWFGDKSQAIFVAKSYGAACDDDGLLQVYGEPPTVGLDHTEIVLGAETMVKIGDNYVSWAQLCNSTSYGVRGITVF